MKLMRHILLVIAFCSIGYVHSQSDAETKGSGRPYRLRSLLNPAARKNSVKEALRRLSNVPIPHPGAAKIQSTERTVPLPASEGVFRSALALVTANEESVLKELESAGNSDLATDAVRSPGEEKLTDMTQLTVAEPRSETVEAEEDGKAAEEESLRTFHHHHHKHHNRESDDSKSTKSEQPRIPDPNQEQPSQATKPICFMPINMGTGPNNVIPGGRGPNNIIWVPNNNNNNPQNNPAGGFITPNNPLNPNYGNNNNPTYPQFPLNSLNFGNVGSLGLGPNLCITPCQNTQNGGISNKNNPDNNNRNEANEPDSISQIVSGGTHGAGMMGIRTKQITTPGEPNLKGVALNNPLDEQLRSAVVAEPSSAPATAKVGPHFVPVNYRYPSAYPGYYPQPQLLRHPALNPYSAYQQSYWPHRNMWY